MLTDFYLINLKQCELVIRLPRSVHSGSAANATKRYFTATNS